MFERDQNTLGFYLKVRRCSEFEREPRYFWFILEDNLVNKQKKISPVIKQFFCMCHATEMKLIWDLCKFWALYIAEHVGRGVPSL